ncbi:hypothetical protein ACFRMQ_14850 [Kitasatospora sp. NPDC056783]
MRIPAAFLYWCTTEDPSRRPARTVCCAQQTAAGLAIAAGAIL